MKFLVVAFLLLLASCSSAQHHPSSITSRWPVDRPDNAWIKGTVVSPTQAITIKHGEPALGAIVVDRKGEYHVVIKMEHIEVPWLTAYGLKGDLVLITVYPEFKVPPVKIAKKRKASEVYTGGHQKGDWSVHHELRHWEKAKIRGGWPDLYEVGWISFSEYPTQPTIPGDSGTGIFNDKGELVSQWTTGTPYVGTGIAGQGLDFTHPFVYRRLQELIKP